MQSMEGHGGMIGWKQRCLYRYRLLDSWHENAIDLLSLGLAFLGPFLFVEKVGCWAGSSWFWSYKYAYAYLGNMFRESKMIEVCSVVERFQERVI